MDYSNFLNQETLILVAVSYAIGLFLRNSCRVRNWLIPWILLILNIAFCYSKLGFNVDSLIQAILITATTVYGNQLVYQTTAGISTMKSENKDSGNIESADTEVQEK